MAEAREGRGVEAASRCRLYRNGI